MRAVGIRGDAYALCDGIFDFDRDFFFILHILFYRAWFII